MMENTEKPQVETKDEPEFYLFVENKHQVRLPVMKTAGCLTLSYTDHRDRFTSSELTKAIEHYHSHMPTVRFYIVPVNV